MKVFSCHSLLLELQCFRLLLNLLEMHTAYKQAVCVSVLQMCRNQGDMQ